MFDWSGFLDLADELVDRSGDEVAERTAINRAYYAAYGSARDYLIRGGTSIPSMGRAHVLVWDQFHAVPDPIHRRIADRGRNLRKRRGWADYDAVVPNLSPQARLAVAMARGLLADLATLP